MQAWFVDTESYIIRVTTQGIERHFSETLLTKPSEFDGIVPKIPPMPTWWSHEIQKIKDDIHDKKIQKRVLYHDIHFTGDNPSHFIKNSEGQGRFLVQLDEHRILYGNSPECTLHKVDDVVSIEVLGGTAPQLTDSHGNIIEKYRHEHDLIIEDLMQRNPELIWKKKHQIKQLGYTNHVRSVLQYNTTEALEKSIERVYPNLAFDGGGINDWWGTLIGWHNVELAQTKLWLAIRCGIYDIKTKTHTVRTGAGITLDSEPEQEWIEIHHKLGWLAKKS